MSSYSIHSQNLIAAFLFNQFNLYKINKYMLWDFFMKYYYVYAYLDGKYILIG